MSVETSLVIGYGLSVVMYGGYWVWLVRRKHQVQRMVAASQNTNGK